MVMGVMVAGAWIHVVATLVRTAMTAGVVPSLIAVVRVAAFRLHAQGADDEDRYQCDAELFHGFPLDEIDGH